MAFKWKNVFSRKNMNLVVGLITLLLVLWLVMYAIPGLFANLFNTILGEMILLGIVVLCGMYNMNLGVGMAIVFVILYQFSHMVK